MNIAFTDGRIQFIKDSVEPSELVGNQHPATLVEVVSSDSY